jgi:hypothetical protein
VDVRVDEPRSHEGTASIDRSRRRRYAALHARARAGDAACAHDDDRITHRRGARIDQRRADERDDLVGGAAPWPLRTGGAASREREHYRERSVKQ